MNEHKVDSFNCFAVKTRYRKLENEDKDVDRYEQHQEDEHFNEIVWECSEDWIWG